MTNFEVLAGLSSKSVSTIIAGKEVLITLPEEYILTKFSLTAEDLEWRVDRDPKFTAEFTLKMWETASETVQIPVSLRSDEQAKVVSGFGGTAIVLLILRAETRNRKAGL